MEAFDINILNLLFVLIAAWAGGTIARRLGYPAILGELLIGIVLGPALLGWINETATVKVLAEVGIILLMVYIGMEIDFRDLKKASWAGLLAATGGFVVPFVLGYYSIIWFGGSSTSGLFVAIAVGVTSLATKSRILVDLKLLNTRIAYVLMAGALISDTLALLIFAGILSFADIGTFNLTELALVAFKAIGFFAITISIGVFVLPRIGAYLARSAFRNSTFYFTIILIVAFAFAELAELAGMHSILGAFMAGLFIKDNLFPKNISKEVYKTFYDVSIGFMAPIFFVSAGFLVDINVFQTDLPMLVTIILLAIVGKIFGTALFYLPSKFGWREGITVGAGMNGRGAVEIIIAGIGLEMGIIDTNIFSILVFMAIFTTMTVPVLLKWTTNWLRNRGELVQMGQRKNILILGVNPLSLIFAEHFKSQTEVVMIDSNRDSVDLAINQGFKCIHGNALKEEVLFETQPETIKSFIGLTSNTEVNMLAAQMARESFYIPENFVVLCKHDKGAGISTLETINAISLFAMKVKLDEWMAKIVNNEVKECNFILKEKTDSRSFVKQLKEEEGDVLPILVISLDKKKRPFHFGDKIDKNETVIYLK